MLAIQQLCLWCACTCAVVVSALAGCEDTADSAVAVGGPALVCGRGEAVTTELTGRVVRAHDCSPVPGASVLLTSQSVGGEQCSRAVTTDAQGYFRVDVHVPADQSLRVALPGGETRTLCGLAARCAHSDALLTAQPLRLVFALGASRPRTRRAVLVDEDALYGLPLYGEPEEDKRAWGDAGLEWLRKRGVDKRTRGDSGMTWMKRQLYSDWWKRGWASDDMPWLRKRTSHLLQFSPERRAWADSGMHWLRRRRRDTEDLAALGTQADAGEEDKRSWGDSGMAWMKRGEAGAEQDKRSWGNAGMTWIKRDGEESEEKDKRSWGDAGMAWIKRDDGSSSQDANDNLDWVTGEEKRAWEDAGMSFLKRHAESKRSWGDAGMAWIKRNPQMDRRSWGDAGMAWIKRSPREKRSWGDAGMSWIKRTANDQPPWAGADWMRHYQTGPKRSWGDAGMSWIKRSPDTDKRSWGDAGMSWIKRSPEDKRSWGDAGMAWIKRNPEGKRSWGDAGMVWIKRGAGGESSSSE